jgi:hypothetical protein
MGVSPIYDLDQITALVDRSTDDHLRAALSTFLALPQDAQKAALARKAAHARGFFKVAEFAAVIGRHNQFVSDRCKAKAIRRLPGGKPYRIPLTEEEVWNK